MRSWHDYYVTGYVVDGGGGTITFVLRAPSETTNDEASRLTVHGVKGYFLEHDLGSNIVFEIKEGGLAEFLDENAPLFNEEKKWGWPLFWKGSTSTTMEYLSQNHAKLWEISTSYGLSGWVVATGVSESEG